MFNLARKQSINLGQHIEQMNAQLNLQSQIDVPQWNQKNVNDCQKSNQIQQAKITFAELIRLQQRIDQLSNQNRAHTSDIVAEGFDLLRREKIDV